MITIFSFFFVQWTQVMQHLLNIKTDYWSQYLNVDSSDRQSDAPQSNLGSTSKYFGELHLESIYYDMSLLNM